MAIWVRREMDKAVEAYRRQRRLEPDRDTRLEIESEMNGLVIAYENVLHELEAHIEEDAT
jgi:hypothetical protein